MAVVQTKAMPGVSERPSGAREATLPFVSVIVPVYDDAARLRLCLAALSRQSYPSERYEVIVVDNGSHDDAASAVADDERAGYLFESRRGSYAARNAGLERALGQIVAFTDSDCIPAEGWIQRGVEHLLQEANCGLVGGRIDVFVRDPARPTALELYEVMRAFPQQKWIEVDHYGATANMFTWRRVIDELGPFDAALKSSGDREWGRRVYAAGYRLVFADDAAVRHPARASWDEAQQKMLRIVGGFRDYLGRKKLLKGLVRDALPPVADVLAIMRDRRLTGWRQRLMATGVLLRLRWLRIRLRARVLLGLPIDAGR